MKEKIMFTLRVIYTKTAKLFHHLLRESTYNDMAHQASDWIPEELRIDKPMSTTKPIELNFNIPKKNRLHWIRRTMQELPH